MRIDGPAIKDEFGRTLMLRGVNLGGSSKVPFAPNGATYQKDGFYNHREISFIGRPFPIDEAEEHFSRLKSWGFTFLRFLVTWEAIEHSGPGIYDVEYLEYVRSILEIANKFGINVFIDPHQDVWSRFSGGDGAPGWTFELVGMDITKFQETGAAFTHQVHGDPLPMMLWSTNATKLAAATMFSLFFGGADLARHTKIERENTQEFFQRHFIGAIKKLAEYLVDLPNVVGYDSMNEPVEGWIGIQDLTKRHTTIEKGFIPTPFQAMQLGVGLPLKLEKWKRGILGPRVIGKQWVNPEGVSVWMDGSEPIWQANGVWKIIKNKPVLLQPNHFAYRNGQRIDFNRDYYVPFNNRFASEIRKIQPKSMIFIEKGFGPSGPEWGEDDALDIVYSPHWYDPVILIRKTFNKWVNYDSGKKKIILGVNRIQRSFQEQLARPLKHAQQRMGNVPVLIGEVGIAYDLDKKFAYKTGDFSAQEKAYDRILKALEKNLHHFTLWNYTADNSNKRGDIWNDEDLSIFSRDQQNDTGDINSGGRALASVLRPYPIATAGKPLEITFDYEKREFRYRFLHQEAISAPTIIYVPTYLYPDGCEIEISDGKYEYAVDDQSIIYWHSEDYFEHAITIKLNPPG